LYYGPQEPPILIKDQKGTWIPVKIWPNSAGYIKETVKPEAGLTWRWPGGETKDAFAQLGTYRFPGGNNNYLAWLQVEQVAHPLGKSRSCKSCHGSPTQVAHVTWEYLDSQGAEPFTGSQKVVADNHELHVKDIKATSKIIPFDGDKMKDFAAWVYLGDIWKTPGDFAIPKSDPAKYRKLEQELRHVQSRFEESDRQLAAREAKGENVRKLRRRWKEDRAAALHAPERAVRP
jgi:hypothetical protein